MKSWVTSSAGTPVSASTAASSRPAAARRRVSSADSGSSSSSAAGRRASARATATRWRSPPDSVARAPVGEVSDPKRSSSASARCVSLGPAHTAQRVGDVLPHASGGRTARTPGRRSRSAGARARRRCRGRCRATPPRRSAPGPRPGARARPRSRSTDVLPAPDGPASARHVAGRDLERDVERERPEPRCGRQRAAPPSHAEPLSSFTDSSSAPETATSTADSASALVKSVEKRS